MQGFNMGRYVPPDLEGVQSGNQIHHKHHLGNRARNLQKTGELTVRFEMPFNVWCLHCDPKGEKVIIGQGVRFNALKKRVGKYYSTPIWAFRMKHSVCGGWIEIRTDPQNTAYVVTDGARRQDKGPGRGRYEGDGVAGIHIRRPGEGEKAKDAFEKLETKVEDKKQYMTEQERMKELYRLSDRQWDDPYEQSRKLRRTFRAERKRREAIEVQDEAMKDRMGLNFELLEETEGDRVRAGMVQFQHGRELGSIEAEKKPMFMERKDVHIRKKRKPLGQEAAAERKAMFREELKGNTRAALDPFLSDNSWQPTARVRKREEKKLREYVRDELPVTARDGGVAADIEEQQHAQSNDGHVSEPHRKPTQPLLVDYGSDSD
ncbi:hypothetical protein KEM54_002799 [Ascosphaera aggregata]|nr:hypothetical protein KEM54_002799 [Ascosphaera aggregata]